MTNPTFKFLRGKTLYADLAAAKTALEDKVKTLQQGEPALVYYKDGDAEDAKHLALFGIGGTGDENATGTGIFYNTIEVDSAIAALGAQISGSTGDQVEKGLTLYALKNYIEEKAGAASAKVVSGNGISVTESQDSQTSAVTYAVAANVELKYVAAVTEEGKESGAKIELLDKSDTGNTFGTIEVSDIIGNGLLQSTSYDKDTGKLTLTFLTASGTTQDTVVDLGALIDINDVGISAESQNYLSVTLDASAGESGGSQAVFAALVQNVSANTKGLADAKDVKTYVDDTIAGLDATVTGKGVNIEATVSEADGKLTGITVSEKYATVAVTAHSESASAAISVENESQLATGKDIQSVATYVDGKVTEEKNRVDALTSSVTSTDGAVAKVKVVTKGGNVTAVTVENASAGVSSGDTDNLTLTATTGTAAVLGSDIPTIKSYVDAKVSGKNVTASGDTYVNASAADNKVTIATQVVDFTVSTSGTNDSTITGTEGKLASSKGIADAVSAFTNARIAEEIKKLDKKETNVSGTNVSFKYSQTGAIVTISDLTVDYASVAYTAHTGETASAQTASITITNEEKIVKGKDVSAATEYAKALSTEDRAYTDAKIETLDAEVEKANIVATNGNDLKVKVVEANGVITTVEASITTLDAGTFGENE